MLATLIALVGVALLWMWGMPRAKARAAKLIGDRLGVEADIEEARFTPGEVELRGVEMRGRSGGLVVRIDEVDTEVSLMLALFQGASAVRVVSARGVRIEVDLHHEGFGESLESVRRKLGRRSARASTAEREEPAAGHGRDYHVTDLGVRVMDREGSVITLNGARIHKESEELALIVAEALVGEQDADHAHVGPFEMALRRSNGTWVLRRLEVSSGRARALRDGEGDRPLVLRLRDAVSLLRSVREAPEEPKRDADPTESEDAATPAERPSTRLFSRLSPDASIAVSDVQIESRISGDHVEEIRDFELSLRGGNNGWYRVEVAGETSNRGRLNVDLMLKPAEARAEGSVTLRRISLALIAPFAPELPLYEPELATLSTQLELVADSTDRVTMEGHIGIRELALLSERIAPEPVRHINIDVRGKGVWLPAERHLTLERGTARVGEARVFVEGEIEHTPEHYRVDLTAKLPPTDCNDVVSAIPEDVLGSLSRFEWSGNWSALTHVAVDSRDLEATELSIRVRNLCNFERTPNWVRVERFQEPFRHRVVEPDDTPFQMWTGPGTENWVPFDDISPFVVPAVISHEDGGFFDHAGFAPWAIRDALARNLEEGRYVVGASTITMQLAKNLYLHREKTIARKAQEVILTWWLESALTKEEILELYLNVIEYGPGVYGLKNAAAYYFGRPPRELSPAEAAFLACMLPSPTRYHVSYERDALTRSMKNRMRRLLEHTAKRERIGPEALAYGLSELEQFQFHHDGDPPPPIRLLPPLGVPEEPETDELDPFEALFIAP